MHWFPVQDAPAEGAPTVLKGPGWGSPGDVNTAGSGYGLFGDMSINSLRAAGYNVLTWDPRGFGESSGTVEVDSPDFEGRDTATPHRLGRRAAGRTARRARRSRAWAWSARRTAAASSSSPPRSTAGSTRSSRRSRGTRSARASTRPTRRSAVGATSSTPPRARATSTRTSRARTRPSDTTGVISDADRQWFLDRGPGDLVGKITAPTLIEQGTIDTLFTLDEAVTQLPHPPRERRARRDALDVQRARRVPHEPGRPSAAGRGGARVAQPVREGRHRRPTSVRVFRYVDQNGVGVHRRRVPAGRVDADHRERRAAQPRRSSPTAAPGPAPRRATSARSAAPRSPHHARRRRRTR